MSAFHRVDDIEAMPAARFFELAYRLPAYQGVLQLRIRAMTAGGDGGTAAAARHGAQQGAARGRVSVTERDNVPVTRAVVASDPTLGGIFSSGTFTRTKAEGGDPRA